MLPSAISTYPIEALEAGTIFETTNPIDNILFLKRGDKVIATKGDTIKTYITPVIIAR